MITLLVMGSAGALTLQEAWDAAAHNDVQLALAREQAIQQGTFRGKAWSALQPRLDVNASYIVNNTEIALDFTELIPPELAGALGDQEPLVVQEKEFWQGEVTVGQRLLSASAIPTLRAAYQLHAAAQQDLRAAESASKGRVAAAYYGLLTAERGVGVAEKGLEIARAQLELAERQHEAGIADDRALVQGRLGVSRAERDLRSAGEALLSARTGFELVAGIPGEDLELPEPLPIPTDLGSAVEAAKASRPDLVAARYRSRALELQRRAQDLRWLPVVDGMGQYAYSENLGFNDQHWNWRIALSASWSLWDGGLRNAESRESASLARSAALAEELTERNAEREIALAFEAHARAESALRAVENEQALAEESLRLAEASFAAGGATWIEVEQARLLLQATELSGLRERMTRDLAAIDLLTRTGSL